MGKVAGFHRHQENDTEQVDDKNVIEKMGADNPILLAFDAVIANNYKPCSKASEADYLLSTQDIYNNFQAHYTEKKIGIPILVQLLQLHNFTTQTFGSAQLWLFSNK